MTNADKLLKDGVSVEEFAKEFESFCEMLNEEHIVLTYKQEMEQFLNCEVQPTLTEDERVILRNIPKQYKTIRRIGNNVQVDTEDKEGFACICAFNHLFQFIKNGEEYEIAELLKGE